LPKDASHLRTSPIEKQGAIQKAIDKADKKIDEKVLAPYEVAGSEIGMVQAEG
jgi:hypothetical protein